jgi:hypothetical protein
MFRSNRRLMPCAVVTMVLLSAPILQAKEQKAFPAAPPPPQIADAKKVFISNGGIELPDYMLSVPSDRLYNQFYAAMKDWGRYELVSAPAQADLVFEIHATSVISAFVDPAVFPHLKLAILDPKTHIVLWTFVEPAGKGEKRFNEAMDKLMADLKQLVEPGSSASTNPKPSTPEPAP